MTRLKKLVKCLLVLAIVWTIAPTDAFAANNLVYYPVEGGNITFDTSSGTITNCDRNVTSAIIPEQIEEVDVVAIQDRAFESCRSLNAISIPDGVMSIGKYAFQGCTSLTNIHIPDSVASIESYTFAGCTSLSSIELLEGTAAIEDYAFQNCTSLSSITISDSVSSIGDSAFSGCTSLDGIHIPKGVLSIGTGVFSGCTSLSDINVAKANTKYASADGVLFSKDMTYLMQYPVRKKQQNMIFQMV